MFEKYSVYVEEIQSNLSLTIDFAAWTEKSYTVTKFILDDHEEVKNAMKDFIIVFRNKLFKRFLNKFVLFIINRRNNNLLYCNRRL